ncbi:flagellin [uncultured Marivita sp.]|uniref:flagellin n=1 Tax=uncultured Marivita sp. TaxID=888080 RepID=UPI002606C15D|nr:flagellin [uncultured Marivita sp.]
MRAIGDLAAFMMSSRFQTSLRNGAESAAEAATTGLAKDKARHLGGATMAVSLLDRKAILLEQHRRGIAEAAVFAGSTQSILGRIQDQAGRLTDNLSLVSQLQSPAELKTISDSAAEVFIDTVNALNSQIAGKYVFSGTATQTKPLPDGADLLALVRTATLGATIAADVQAALDSWFDTPGGGFETTAYQGSDTGFMSLPLTKDDTATFGLRADGDTVKDLLKGLAKAAVAGDPALNLSIVEQSRLLGESRADILQADRTLTEERASLGLTESIIENARVMTEANQARIATDRLSLLGIDQFEAASEFEAAQQQLEVFYRIAARQSRTSLAEYLR